MAISPRGSNGDTVLAGLRAVADQVIRSTLSGLPEDLLEASGPHVPIDICVALDPDAGWPLARMALDALGARISDQPPFGSWMRLPAPTKLMSKVLVTLRIGVPARSLGEFIPRIETAVHTMMRQLLGPGADLLVMVDPSEEDDVSTERATPRSSSGRSVTDVTEWIAAAERITVLTGAGISTESGIPDYRGPDGVWTRDPAAQRLVDIDTHLADPEVRRQVWQERVHHPAWEAAPSPGHLALVELERSGRLRALITQNIDGLHQAAGSSSALVLELHGTIHRARCLACGHETPMEEQLERVRAGEADPECAGCGGIQRSATVAFGQQLDPAVLQRAVEAASDC